MRLLFLIITVLSAITSFSQAPASKGKKPGKVIFFEDFSGATLDRTKWNVIVTGFHVNNEQQAYVDSTATIRLVKGEAAQGATNGALIIQPIYSPGFVTFDGKKFDFISGRIDTRNKVEFTYGTIAARIKMTAGSGLWPAFWALGNGDWPGCGEIDIMEYVGEPDWVSAALHGKGYSGDTPLVNKVFLKKEFDVTKWHVYSVEWSKDALLFKIDDMLFYRVTRPMIENYGPWAYDTPEHVILNFALGGAYPEKTNGVKQPYPGIPQSTVDLIKNDQAKFVVDWVKVTSPD